MNIDNIYFIYSNVDKFPTINSFMATNTTGKVNLGQEGKPTYYNCVLHVYAPIEKIWKFNEKSLSHMSYRTDGEFIKVRFIYADEEIHLPSPTSEKGKC